MNKRIIIVGHGASGKDELKTRFINKGYTPSVSFTTRLPRKNEVDGVDYIFIKDRKFDEMVSNGEFYEHNVFNKWCYGTHKSDFDGTDIFIMTPNSIEQLPKDIRDSSIVIFIDIDENIRAKRLSNRNDADDVKRRLQADRDMFFGFTDYDLRIENPTF